MKKKQLTLEEKSDNALEEMNDKIPEENTVWFVDPSCKFYYLGNPILIFYIGAISLTQSWTLLDFHG